MEDHKLRQMLSKPPAISPSSTQEQQQQQQQLARPPSSPVTLTPSTPPAPESPSSLTSSPSKVCAAPLPLFRREPPTLFLFPSPSPVFVVLQDLRRLSQRDNRLEKLLGDPVFVEKFTQFLKA